MWGDGKFTKPGPYQTFKNKRTCEFQVLSLLMSFLRNRHFFIIKNKDVNLDSS